MFTYYVVRKFKKKGQCHTHEDVVTSQHKPLWQGLRDPAPRAAEETEASVGNVPTAHSHETQIPHFLPCDTRWGIAHVYACTCVCVVCTCVCTCVQGQERCKQSSRPGALQASWGVERAGPSRPCHYLPSSGVRLGSGDSSGRNDEPQALCPP